MFSSPGLVWLFESWHTEIPGPPAPSVQPKAVGTLWLSMYVPPEAGDEIDAVGGAATVYEADVVAVRPSASSP